MQAREGKTSERESGRRRGLEKHLAVASPSSPIFLLLPRLLAYCVCAVEKQTETEFRVVIEIWVFLPVLYVLISQ